MSVLEKALLNSTVSCYLKLHAVTKAWIVYDREINATLTSAHQTMMEIRPGLSGIQDKIMQMKILIDMLLLTIAVLLFYIIATSPRKLDSFSGGETAEEKVESVA